MRNLAGHFVVVGWLISSCGANIEDSMERRSQLLKQTETNSGDESLDARAEPVSAQEEPGKQEQVLATVAIPLPTVGEQIEAEQFQVQLTSALQLLSLPGLELEGNLTAIIAEDGVLDYGCLTAQIKDQEFKNKDSELLLRVGTLEEPGSFPVKVKVGDAWKPLPIASEAMELDFIRDGLQPKLKICLRQGLDPSLPLTGQSSKGLLLQLVAAPASTPDEPFREGTGTPDFPVGAEPEPVPPVNTPDQPVRNPEEPVSTPDEPVRNPEEPVSTPDEPVDPPAPVEPEPPLPMDPMPPVAEPNPPEPAPDNPADPVDPPAGDDPDCCKEDKPDPGSTPDNPGEPVDPPAGDDPEMPAEEDPKKPCKDPEHGDDSENTGDRPNTPNPENPADPENPVGDDPSLPDPDGNTGDGGTVKMCYTMNFDLDPFDDPIPTGMEISDTYSAWGVAIRAENRHSQHPDMAIRFDSGRPTGGDADLRTPGSGKNNDKAMQGILIIAENAVDRNGDGLVDNPDDEARGGFIEFTFMTPASLEELKMIDVEESNVRIVYLNEDGTDSILPVPALGDNSVQTFKPQTPTIDGFRVEFKGSGAIDEIVICRDKEL